MHGQQTITFRDIFGSIRGRSNILLPSEVPKSALGSIKPPTLRLPRVFAPTVSDRVVKLTAHHNLVPRLSMRGATPPPPTSFKVSTGITPSSGDQLQWRKLYSAQANAGKIRPGSLPSQNFQFINSHQPST